MLISKNIWISKILLFAFPDIDNSLFPKFYDIVLKDNNLLHHFQKHKENLLSKVKDFYGQMYNVILHNYVFDPKSCCQMWCTLKSNPKYQVAGDNSFWKDNIICEYTECFYVEGDQRTGMILSKTGIFKGEWNTNPKIMDNFVPIQHRPRGKGEICVFSSSKPCGISFKGEFKNGHLANGTLYLADGSKIKSKHWKWHTVFKAKLYQNQNITTIYMIGGNWYWKWGYTEKSILYLGTFQEKLLIHNGKISNRQDLQFVVRKCKATIEKTDDLNIRQIGAYWSWKGHL